MSRALAGGVVFPRALWLSLLIALGLVSSARADALRRVEHTVEKPKPKPRWVREGEVSPSTRRSSEPGQGDVTLGASTRPGGYDGMWAPGEGGEDDSAELPLLNAIFRIVGFMWTVPRLFDQPSLTRYSAYPYADGPGLLRGSDDGALEAGRQPLALQVDMESGFLLQGVVPGSFALRLQLPYRFELSSRVSLLSDVSQSDQGHAAAATSHLSYRFAQTKRLEFRTGLGVRNYTLTSISWGVDMLYGLDAYLSRWSVVRAELHAGILGSAFVGEARATVGMMVKRCELYAGYDHTAFMGNGRTQLGGPIGGVRAWF